MTAENSKELDNECSRDWNGSGSSSISAEDNTGWQFKYIPAAAAIFHVGLSDLIVSRVIALKQFCRYRDLGRRSAVMKNGQLSLPTLICLATGYKPPEELVRKTVRRGKVAGRVGTIWGLWRRNRTAQHVCAHRPARPLVHAPGGSRNAPGSARKFRRAIRQSEKGCLPRLAV